MGKYYKGQIIYKLEKGSIISGEITEVYGKNSVSCVIKWKNGTSHAGSDPDWYIEKHFFVDKKDASRARNVFVLSQTPKFLGYTFLLSALAYGIFGDFYISTVIGMIGSVIACVYDTKSEGKPRKDSWEPRDFGDYGDHGDPGGF